MMKSTLKSNYKKTSQEDYYNSGAPSDNPFQTMYMATIGSQNPTNITARDNLKTPNGRRASAAPFGNQPK